MRCSSVRGLLVASIGFALAGCTDRIPTLSNAGDLAPGARPTTIEHVIEAARILRSARVQAGGTGPANAPYRLVANRFDGALTAHTLARFRAFPDTIVLAEAVDSQFRYIEADIIALVPDTLQATGVFLDFELWTVTEPWDSAGVSWEYAVDRPEERVPWSTPGGTRGQRLAIARWDSAEASDSVIWTVPGAAVEQLATGEIPGLMVTLVQPNSRAQISPLAIRATIQPSVRQDTTFTRTIGPGPHNFIFTPEPLQPDDVLRVGGITSDRSYLLLDLGVEIPVCPGPATATCDRFASPRVVSLNRVELLLDPLPVPRGFRPIAPLQFSIRRVFEPGLGERAPLGPIIAIDTVTVAQAAGTGTQPVSVDLTAVVERLLREDETELALAFLVQPDASTFSYAWFSRNPRLRFLYTLPQQPELP